MSKPADVEVNGGPGCLFLIGAIIIASCIGSIYDTVHGWLAFGVFMVVWGILGAAAEMRTLKIKRASKLPSDQRQTGE